MLQFVNNGNDRQPTFAYDPRPCLTRQMDETDANSETEASDEAVSAEADDVVGVVSEVTTTVTDIDGDGVADVIEETTTTAYDIDGDGVPDIIEQTTTTAYDVDGDGIPDIIESTTITGVDVDGDGSFSEDEITIEETIAIREDLVDDGSAPA